MKNNSPKPKKNILPAQQAINKNSFFKLIENGQIIRSPERKGIPSKKSIKLQPEGRRMFFQTPPSKGLQTKLCFAAPLANPPQGGVRVKSQPQSLLSDLNEGSVTAKPVFAPNGSLPLRIGVKKTEMQIWKKKVRKRRLDSEFSPLPFLKKVFREKTLHFVERGSKASLYNSPKNKSEGDIKKKDSIFSFNLEKMVNLLMVNGNKEKALSICYKTLALILSPIRRGTSLSKVEWKNKKSSRDSKDLKNLLLFFSTKKIEDCNHKEDSNVKINRSSVDFTLPRREVNKGSVYTTSFKNKKLSMPQGLKNLPFQIFFEDPLKIIAKAILNVSPILEVRKIRRGGTDYLVPGTIHQKRKESLAFRLIIGAAKKRKKNSKLSFEECLAIEILNGYKKKGAAIQKRDEFHKLAESNRAYIRYRWW